MIAWKSLGLFYNPNKTIDSLYEESSSTLLFYGFGLSVSGALSLTLANVLQNGYFTSLVVARLIPYYAGYFFLISFVSTCALLMGRRFNIFKAIGLFLISDFPLIITFPLVMIGLAFSPVSWLMSTIFAFVVFYTWIIKLLVCVRSFKISIIQALTLNIMPSLIIMVLMVLGVIDGVLQLIKNFW